MLKRAGKILLCFSIKLIRDKRKSKDALHHLEGYFTLMPGFFYILLDLSSSNFSFMTHIGGQESK